MDDPWAQFADAPAPAAAPAADPYAQFSDAPALGTPAPPPVPKPKPKGIVANVTGFMANVNRGLGVGDELAAGANTIRDVVTGRSGPDLVQTYKDELAHQRQIEDDFASARPMTAALARGTGNAALMAVPAGPGAEAFAEGNLMTNAARGATTAGLTGAGYAAVDRGTVGQRMTNAAAAAHDPITLSLGAVAGGLAPRAPKAEGPAAPTLEDLTAQKNAAYKAVDDSGVRYTPEAFNSLMRDIATEMDAEGFNSGLHPKAAAMMQRVGLSDRSVGGYAPTLSQLDQLRQQIGRDVAASSDAGERRMGAIMRDRIDAFIANAGPDAITGGDPQAAAAMIAKARDLNTRVAKLQSLDNLDTAAENRASVTGSGGNINNATRQNVLRFMTGTKNLTPEEQAAAQKVVDGTPMGNLTRQVGKLSPEGNGLMTGLHLLGALPSHGATVVAAGTGFIAKRVSDAITAGNVQALRDLIASGGQTAAEVARQVSSDPAYAELRAQLANDLAVQAGVQGTARRGSVTAQIEGHPEYGVGVSRR